MIIMSYDTKATCDFGTDYKIFAPARAESFGIELAMTNDPKWLSLCLRASGCAVAHVGGDHGDYIGLFPHKGHYMTVIAE